VNGRIDPATVPAGFHLGRFADLPASAASALAHAPGIDRALAHLNAAYHTDGFVLDLPDGVILNRPIHIIHWAEAAAPSAVQTRSLIRLGKGARASIIESVVGTGPSWS